jgi:hypothetical protein
MAPGPLDEAILRRESAQRAAEIGRAGSVLAGPATMVVASDLELGQRLTEQDASFDRRQVFRVVAETATQGFGCDAIRQRVEAFRAGPAVVKVAPGFLDDAGDAGAGS